MNKNEIKHTLTYLGLKEDTAGAYLACLSLGSATASDIAKAAKLPRTVAYGHLDELETRGLVSASISGGTKKFTANDPDILLKIADQQKEELQSALPALLDIFTSSSSNRPKLRFYADLLGIKTFHESILDSQDKFYRVMGSINDEELHKTVGVKYVLDWTQRRIELGIDHKSLRPLSSKPKGDAKKSLLTQSNREVLREIRYAPESIRLPILIYLFDNKAAFVSGRAGNLYAAVLESKDVFDSLVSIFEAIWAISEKVDN